LNDINWTINDLSDLGTIIDRKEYLETPDNNDRTKGTIELAGTIIVNGIWSEVEAKNYAGLTKVQTYDD